MKTTIKFPKSDSFAFFVTINKISKALDNAFFTVKENPDEEPVLQKNLGAGISLSDSRLYKNQLSYKVQIDGADTANMEVGVRYFFDVKGTIGNAQKTFLWGELILSDTETGYLNPAMQGDTVAFAQVYTATFETGAQSQYVETESDPVATAKIGDMTKLNTTAKDTLVKAINEVNAPTFTEAEALENVVSGEKQSTLWGKVKKCFSSLKALAFKDSVGTADFATDAKCPSATNADNATNAGTATVAQYASADTSKGTIEERLTNLGFKTGAVEALVGTASENSLKRQGNVVIGKLKFSVNKNSIEKDDKIGTIPANFRPKQAQEISVRNKLYTSVYGENESYDYCGVTFSVGTNGDITVSSINTDTYVEQTINKLTYYTRMNTSNIGGEFELIFAYETTPQ